MPRGTKRKLIPSTEDEKSVKKPKLELSGYDPQEEILLPDEIVLQIFRQLERADILRCSIACRHWYRIGLTDEFHWFYITTFTLVECASAYHFLRNEKLKKFAELDKEQQEYELKLWQSDPLHNGHPVRIESTKDDTHWMYDEQDEVVAIAKFDTGYSDGTTNFDFNSKKNASLWKYDITEATEQYAETVRGQRHWIIRVHINLKRVDALVIDKNTNTIPNKEALLLAIADEWKLSTMLEKALVYGTSSIINKPTVFNEPIMQPEGLINNFELSKHQLEAATWMKSIEEKIGEDISYSAAIRWKGSRVYFDIDKRKIIHPTNIGKFMLKEKISGGVLSNNTDLINSFEVIGLILASSKSKIEPHPNLINSRATLIMCLYTDAKQWEEDIKCTYEDFKSKYDVIICTYEVIRSAEYICLPSTRAKRDILPEERNAKVQAVLEELKIKKNFNEVKSPIIEHFFFHRVVFDKGHEAETHDRPLYLTRKIWGHSKWFVSAQPFYPAGQKIMTRFLQFKNTSPYLLDFIYKKLMWRNSQTLVPDAVQDEVHLVDMSVIERAVSFYNTESADPYCAKSYVEGIKAVAEKYLKRIKFLLRQKEDYKQILGGETVNRRAILTNIEEILEQELARMDDTTTQLAQSGEEKELVLVQLEQGTKVAKMFSYLKKLFVEKPDSRVVVFSMENPSDILQEHQNVERLLNEHGIATTSVQVDKDEDIDEFKKKLAPFKVILMNSAEHSAITNSVGATHVILLDYPLHDSQKMNSEFSSTVLRRAFRQGQTSQVVVVRFIFKDTREHRLYLLSIRKPTNCVQNYDPASWKPHQE